MLPSVVLCQEDGAKKSKLYFLKIKVFSEQIAILGYLLDVDVAVRLGLAERLC